MVKHLTTTVFLCISFAASAQYLETFSTPNKGYLLNQLDDFTGVDWSMTAWANQPPAAFGRDNADYFQTTAAGVLEGIDFDQEVCWESPLLNTAAAPVVSLSVDLHWADFDTDISGNPCTEASLDYIKVQYSVNGGAYTLVPNIAGGNTCATVGYVFGSPTPPFAGTMTATQAGIPGSSNLRIRVCVNTNSNSELVSVDNVSVPTPGVTLGCSAPVLSTVVTQITCGGATGAIDLSVSGGVPGYTYAWNNLASSQDLNGLNEGTYTVTVTDAAGCTATASATVLAMPLGASLHVGPVTCPGVSDGEIDLTVTGGMAPLTYSWSDLPGANDPQDRTGLPAGNYTVTVADNTGCTVVSSIAVGIQAPGPYLEIFSTDGKGLLTGSSCPGIDASACSNSNFSGVNWSMYGLAALLGIEPDDYFHTTNGKLEGKDFDQVICWESPLIDIAPPGSADAFSLDLAWGGFDQEPPGPNPMDLVADHIDVEYSVDGGAWIRLPNQAGGGLTGHTVVYINGAGSNLTGSATVSAGGIDGSTLRIRVCGYLNADAETMSIDNVSAPSSNGLFCPLPGLSTAVTNPSCFGSSDGAVDLTVSGGTPPFTFLWSNNAATEDISGIPAGQYTVVVTDNAGVSAVTTVVVNDPPAIVIVQDTALSKPITCFGGNDGALAIRVANGAEPLVYSWSNGLGDNPLDSISSGVYSVTVTDIKGCTGVLSNMILSDPPPVIGTLEPYDNPLCPGATTLLLPDTIFGGAGEPYLYTLNGSVFPVPVGAGTHIVRFFDGADCSVSDTIVLSEFPPSGAVIVGSDTACLDMPEGYTLPGNFTAYQWAASNNGLISQGQGTGTITVLWATPGVNTLIVYFTDENGCPDSAQFQLYVDFCVGTKEIALPGVQVQPNPFGDWLMVQFDHPVQAGTRLRLLDAQGRALTEQILTQESTRFESGHLPGGVYYLNITESGRSGVWKVIKIE